MTTCTIIDEQTPHAVELGPDLGLDTSLLGWERKPEGLCRNDVCIPVPAGPITLSTFARLTQRPLVVDETHHVAALGAAAEDRRSELQSGMAPDFELPDLNGKLHRLSDYRGRKVVLYAYGSW